MEAIVVLSFAVIGSVLCFAGSLKMFKCAYNFAFRFREYALSVVAGAFGTFLFMLGALIVSWLIAKIFV